MDEIESSVLVALLLRLCTGTYRPDEGEAGEADLTEKGADDIAEEGWCWRLTRMMCGQQYSEHLYIGEE